MGDWTGLRGDIDRSSTAERVAAALRAKILAGDIGAGRQLNEKALGEALTVSRNTLREAFRLLTHERLLVHSYSRGVFVRKPDERDVHDLITARQVIELGALHHHATADDAARQALRDADAHDLLHRRLVALTGSTRLVAESDRLLAEQRLVLRGGVPPEVHDLAALLDRADLREAERRLTGYFDLCRESGLRAVGRVD
ncbi:hypothetical protein GCM10022243_26810 [Saccharothrix violaceirubra]|uniref:DNA-binding FadR family transcriptional regulator n=1 Tax=Saccharothrix violaceirubra TaxID=413306 RepID=A0A7W7TA70_9PSEU|nr:GntR family transcriptional regulator [Saccharothrix violaceirubra]MBB4969397.1 DNA-binding FadR family transcriptional regulator [Saccharothrix violaceirubra]